jgi:uncharacterized membrane protein
VSGRLRRTADSLRTGFWAVPATCVVLALLLALALVELDRRLDRSAGRFTFGAGPDGAREVLSAITTSMITFTGLVFSITIVVLQLTSSQFSPRVLRTFLRDRQTQLSLGVFVATFVYAVMVLRTVDGSDGARFVPAVATTVGVALLLVSVAVFVGYIHHIATAIQVSSLVRAVGDETRSAIERRLHVVEPQRETPLRLGAPTRQIVSPAHGVVTAVDDSRLVAAAREAGVVLVLRVALGRFVPAGAPVLDVHGDGALDDGAAARCVHLGKDRTMEHDVAFGFRQLVDVAERALSPGTNDPTTAVQALDELHDLLRRLATRPLPDGVHRDADDEVRLLTPAPRFEDFLSLALEEVDHYGADASQVQVRIDQLLADLAAAAIPEHLGAVLATQQRRRRAGGGSPCADTGLG